MNACTLANQVVDPGESVPKVIPRSKDLVRFRQDARSKERRQSLHRHEFDFAATTCFEQLCKLRSVRTFSRPG
jgi:hypothetical protein